MTEDGIILRDRGLHPGAVIDIAGEDCSFEIHVVSPVFAGLGPLQRQKPLLALFRDEIASGALHALSIRASTPEELAGQGGLIQISL